MITRLRSQLKYMESNGTEYNSPEDQIKKLEMDREKLGRDARSSKYDLSAELRKHQQEVEKLKAQLADEERTNTRLIDTVSRLTEDLKAERDKLEAETQMSIAKNAEIARLTDQIRNLENGNSETGANVPAESKTQPEYDNEAFEAELKLRMQCEICLNNRKRQCCPACRKGVCWSCFNKLRGNGGRTDCPYCRHPAFGWPSILMPRL